MWSRRSSTTGWASANRAADGKWHAPRATRAEAATAAGDRAILTLALDYGGRWDVAEVTRSIARDVAAGVLNPCDILEDTISERLATNGLPDPDLCIRTAGETRISNFLLWQFAYAEFWFTEVL